MFNNNNNDNNNSDNHNPDSNNDDNEYSRKGKHDFFFEGIISNMYDIRVMLIVVGLIVVGSVIAMFYVPICQEKQLI